MRNLKIGLVTGVMAISLLSCQKDDEAPVINIEAPTNPAELTRGQEVHAEFMFTDNEALASYYIHVSNEDGSHNHDFEFEKEGKISGLSYEFHEHFDVPDSIAFGHYHLNIEVIDLEGNIAYKVIELHIEE